jgi:hypothetical protein
MGYLAQPLMVFRKSGLVSMSQISFTASKCALSLSAFLLFFLALRASGLRNRSDSWLLSDTGVGSDLELLLLELSVSCRRLRFFFLRLLLSVDCSLLSLGDLSGEWRSARRRPPAPWPSCLVSLSLLRLCLLLITTVFRCQ